MGVTDQSVGDRGAKQEIAHRLVRIGGEVFEAIVFEDEEVLARPDPAAREPDCQFQSKLSALFQLQGCGFGNR